jgi:dTDP-4-amino-4,6-dideoxygalactose transaminase
MTGNRVPYVDLAAQHAPLEEPILEAVRRVLRHGQFILGPEVDELERALEAALDVPSVVTTSSGTDALVLALRLRGIGPGDEVITVSHSFVATATAIVLVGATPVFVDIDEETMLMDPAALSGALTDRTRAVLPVHLNGYPCDMDPISEFCADRGLSLIEDCAQAIGATYKGRSVGTFGVGCFSLHPLKVLSACGDGGFVTVSSEEERRTLQALRSIGLVDRNTAEYISGNARFDALSAAILSVKLPHLQSYVRARRSHASFYAERLRGKVRLPKSHSDRQGVFSAYCVRHPRRDVIVSRLQDEGVDAKIHYPRLIHQQPAFAHLPAAHLPVSERVAHEIFSLPVSPELSSDQRNFVVQTLHGILEEL